MAEGGSGPSVSNPPGAKKRRRECHFDSRCLKEFESEGIKKSSKGSLLRGVAPKFSARLARDERPGLTSQSFRQVQDYENY